MSNFHSLLRCLSSRTRLLAAFLGVLFSATQPAQPQTLTVLYTFTGKKDGRYPLSRLVLNSNGDLYGTTSVGKTGEGGTVFRLAATGVYNLLYGFTGMQDGGQPYAGLVRDVQGNLYGTTFKGGLSNTGTVFKLAPDGTETVLHHFTLPGSFPKDGMNPAAGLMMDSAGNLFGTTEYGIGWYGTVFEIKDGKEKVLHNFKGPDGIRPLADLIRDAQGNLYGTTSEGGINGNGTVFEVNPMGTRIVLYKFTGLDGANPAAGLLQDAEGNLYGTTSSGGDFYSGTVFKLDPVSKKLTVLHSFAGGFSGGPDGNEPAGDLVMDANGNLLGTTLRGGGPGCGGYGCGTIFTVTPTGEETVLYSFTGGADGGFPAAGLVMDAEGNLYGTTNFGGDHTCNRGGGCGVVF